MNTVNILELLQKVGMETFVKYFDYYKQAPENQDLIKVFRMNGETWKESSAGTKAFKGKKIFELGEEVEALKLVIQANPLKVKGGMETIVVAKQLLNRYKE